MHFLNCTILKGIYFLISPFSIKYSVWSFTSKTITAYGRVLQSEKDLLSLKFDTSESERIKEQTETNLSHEDVSGLFPLIILRHPLSSSIITIHALQPLIQVLFPGKKNTFCLNVWSYKNIHCPTSFIFLTWYTCISSLAKKQSFSFSSSPMVASDSTPNLPPVKFTGSERTMPSGRLYSPASSQRQSHFITGHIRPNRCPIVELCLHLGKVHPQRRPHRSRRSKPPGRRGSRRRPTWRPLGRTLKPLPHADDVPCLESLSPTISWQRGKRLSDFRVYSPWAIRIDCCGKPLV